MFAIKLIEYSSVW